MKKVISLILCVLLLGYLLPLGAFADGAGFDIKQISVTDKELKVAVYLKNPVGIISSNILIAFDDSVLTLTNVDMGKDGKVLAPNEEERSSDLLNCSGEMYSSINYPNGQAALFFLDQMKSSTEYAKIGYTVNTDLFELFILTFSVKNGKSANKQIISVSGGFGFESGSVNAPGVKLTVSAGGSSTTPEINFTAGFDIKQISVTDKELKVAVYLKNPVGIITSDILIAFDDSVLTLTNVDMGKDGKVLAPNEKERSSDFLNCSGEMYSVINYLNGKATLLFLDQMKSSTEYAKIGYTVNTDLFELFILTFSVKNGKSANKQIISVSGGFGFESGSVNAPGVKLTVSAGGSSTTHEINFTEEKGKAELIADKVVSVKAGITPEELLAMASDGTTLSAPGAIKTGMKLVLIKNGKTVDSILIIIKGDVNCDGQIAAADARLVLRYSVGLENLNEASVYAAKVDADDKVSASDARLVLRRAVGLESLCLNNSDYVALTPRQINFDKVVKYIKANGKYDYDDGEYYTYSYFTYTLSSNTEFKAAFFLSFDPSQDTIYMAILCEDIKYSFSLTLNRDSTNAQIFSAYDVTSHYYIHYLEKLDAADITVGEPIGKAKSTMDYDGMSRSEALDFVRTSSIVYLQILNKSVNTNLNMSLHDLGLTSLPYSY